MNVPHVSQMGGRPRKKQNKRKKQKLKRITPVQKRARQRKVSRRNKRKRKEAHKSQLAQANALVSRLKNQPDSEQARIFAQGRERAKKKFPIRFNGRSSVLASPFEDIWRAEDMLDKYREGFLRGDETATFRYGLYYDKAHQLSNMISDIRQSMISTLTSQAVETFLQNA